MHELLRILIEFLLTYIFFYFFAVIGNNFLKNFGSDYFSSIVSSYGQLFTSFFCGLFLVIYIYSLIVTKGLTINLLILPLFYFLFITNKTYKVKGTERLRVRKMPYFEVALIALLVVIILHCFPESEYKQADSFFYLKIAESLNATGQENLNHYFNIYDPAFHGMEPYHYVEFWITAFITRITERFYASIYIHRYVSQALVLTAVVIGLYYLAEGILKRKISVAEKFFCWTIFFILPDLIIFFPALQKVFISNFEGNILERPNFRIAYLVLIPVFLKLYNGRPLKGRVTYLLLLLSVVSFKFALVILPALIIYNAYIYFVEKRKQDAFRWIELAVFIVLFAGIYLLFPVNDIPALYHEEAAFFSDTLRGWRFVIFSTATSITYILLITAFFVLPLILIYKKDFFQLVSDLFMRYQLFLLIALIALLAARIFYLKDNAYQFLFVSHIIATFFIWLLYLLLLSKQNKALHYVMAALYITALFFARTIITIESKTGIFSQNGRYVYEGKKYSEKYIHQVRDYFSRSGEIVGGYIGDSVYYKNTYYSRRNPNVYFLPISYIVSPVKNGNFEFCLSHPTDVTYQVSDPVHLNYLQNALQRSFYVRFIRENGISQQDEALIKFIRQYHLSYLVLTKNYKPAPVILEMVKSVIRDENTGEQFFIMQ